MSSGRVALGDGRPTHPALGLFTLKGGTIPVEVVRARRASHATNKLRRHNQCVVVPASKKRHVHRTDGDAQSRPIIRRIGPMHQARARALSPSLLSGRAARLFRAALSLIVSHALSPLVSYPLPPPLSPARRCAPPSWSSSTSRHGC